MKIAAAAYPIDWLESWDDYVAKLTRWVEDARGADLLVFPEYGAMELASLDGSDIAGDLEASIDAVSKRIDVVDALHAELAARFDVHILAASAPVRDGHKRPFNRARLFSPGGLCGVQDKLIMTRFEREEWDIAPGRQAKVFETSLGRIGVIICYDSEFPLIARAMVEAGAEILLAPSCTEALAGYWRVRIGSMARALESQCVVVHAPTVGPAAWSPVMDENVGAAAIYGPPDRGFPSTGVIAEGVLNQPGWVFADIDLEAVREVRRDGIVLNATHWAEQGDQLGSVCVETLKA